MGFKRFLTVALVLLPASAPLLPAQNQKDMIIQMQRDMSLMQEQIRTMQRTQDEKFAAITESLRNTLDQVNRLNATLAVTQATLNEKLGDITKNVSAPISAVGTKVDSMADQFQSLSNTVADLNSRIGKLDAKVVELQKMIQVMQQPVAPPPSTVPGGAPAAGGSATPPPAEKLYDDAQRDFSAGSYDLALQGFQEYLKNYGTSQMAADAQFFIGEIFFRRDDFEGAVKEYNKVIDNYADSSRVPNARYMKGVSYLKLSRRSDAKREFLYIVEKYPGHQLTPKAKDYLKVLGVNTSQAPAASGAKKTVTRKR
jgi:tol-pal system protein YbgF